MGSFSAPLTTEFTFPPVTVVESAPTNATGAPESTNDGDIATAWRAVVGTTEKSGQAYKVLAICSSTSNATIAVEAGRFFADGWQDLFVECPAGSPALGGGAVTNPVSYVSASAPANATGHPETTQGGDLPRFWRAAIRTEAAGTYKAFAICEHAAAPPPPTPPAPSPPPPPPTQPSPPAPPPTQPSPPAPLPPKLTAAKPVVGKALTGKAFGVSILVKDAATGKAVKGQIVCQARLGRTLVRLLRRSITVSGRATCSWRLPAAARGKTVSGSIGESYRGSRITRSFSAEVR
jgi:hypothetical protein